MTVKPFWKVTYVLPSGEVYYLGTFDSEKDAGKVGQEWMSLDKGHSLTINCQ